jgi:CheY-like chemotaxis protein
MISTILESRGMVVTSTTKTDELASRISSQRGAARFDLVLLDLEMPGSDGWQVQDALRASGCLTPVVALTAHDIQPLKLKALECGFSGVLSKPLSLPALADMVDCCVMRGPLRLAG